MKGLRLLVAIGGLAFLAGCTTGGVVPVGGVQPVADNDAVFELLSLDPVRPFNAPPGEFHGWSVLGRTSIEDQSTRRKLLNAFNLGVSRHNGDAALCFNPRHGVRISRPDGIHEYVICFECFQVRHFIDGQPQKGMLISDSPRPVFNKALQDAGVPLPKAFNGT